MKAFKTLPENYREIYSVDLQKDKKAAATIVWSAFAVSILLIIPMHFFVSLSTLFSMEQGVISYFVRFIRLIVFTVIYMVCHELIHGRAMKICGTSEVKYGFTGMYAFAGSDDYYDKSAYIFIALAPVIILGAVIAVINFWVTLEWFWVIYFIQVTNISGAAGDIFVTVRFSRFPSDILIKDSGVGMTVYSRTNIQL